MVNIVFTLLTPLAANISYIAVLVVRCVEGLGAVRFPVFSITNYDLNNFQNLLNLGSHSTSCSRYADQMGFATGEKCDNFIGLRR